MKKGEFATALLVITAVILIGGILFISKGGITGRPLGPTTTIPTSTTTTTLPGTCECNSCSNCITKLNDPSCTTVNLVSDIINSSGTCVDITDTSNKTLECDGHLIDGIGLLYGVRLYNVTNVTVKNCVIDGFGDGIRIEYYSKYNVIDNNTIKSNTVYGIQLRDDADYNNITGNTIINNSNSGIYMNYVSYLVVDDNIVENNEDHGLRVSTCFLAGTSILMADGSYKEIEDVKKGDFVKSFDELTGAMTSGKVINTYFHDKTDSYLVINDVLKLTSNHPMYVNGKWKEAGDIKIGDVLMDKNGNDVAVVSVEIVEETVPVYNLEVAGEHNYFAEDLLTHNKCPRLFTDDGTGYKFDSLLNVAHDGGETDKVFSYPLKHIATSTVMIEDDPYEDNYIDFIKLKVGDKIINPVSCNCDLSLITE
ncbi:right-handed parallel beta-helix repeat-containing protein, partial [Candidatus Woesearchaeota archaeon]|nr:right-handed parallel beta-helix repeat-containing protein [Candidatus Woesearchaeota archaeon]